MPISIKNPATEELARKLASLTGESLTDAIRHAVDEKYQRLCRKRAALPAASELKVIALRCASRPAVSELTADQILGYDESGIPTR